MSSMNLWGRDHALAGVALLALFSGCATNIQGSEEPPVDWVADAPSSQCVALSGNYFASGRPAPANADAGSTYGLVWPTEGSLLSILELGSNANPRKHPRMNPSADPNDIVPSINIVVDGSGSVKFEAKNASGGIEKLRPQMWTCESGALTSLAAIGSANFDSYVRLWRHGDALIAEETIRSTSARANETGAHKPVARFYYRFHPWSGGLHAGA